MTNIKGNVLKVLPKETGSTQGGKEWKKTSFIIETTDQYPKKICFSAYGDKADAAEKLTSNMSIEVFYNPESREYNNKWYTELKAWKWETEKSNQSEVKSTVSKPGFGNEDSQELPF